MNNGKLKTDILKIADREFNSRLMIGTGKYPSPEIMREAIKQSGAEIITVALRRVDLNDPKYDLLSQIHRENLLILPNTSGAMNAEEAIRSAKLAKAAGISDWIKLEITPSPKHLLPDGAETLKATEKLVKLGFKVLPYINADPVLAKRLEEAGASTVMPLAAPIGTNKGLRTIDQIKIIIQESFVPVVVDAGIGKPSDAALAMEIGVDAVMINTAISTSNDPVLMAEAFKTAIQAGRKAFLAGLGPVSETANASSPLDWLKK